MTKPYDSFDRFPTTRVEFYPHWPIGDDKIDHLAVDVSVVEVGMVTIAASTKNPSDSYGVELDLSPSDARSLGHKLIEAAAHAEERPQSDATAI